ncbi:MAG TPA: hypothetical protein VEC16_06610 [Alphaproteobacteria bacterium]|nr:hypothetical protein [Alphaproteobacteria bacterium]
MEMRKIQLVGGRSYAVSLPKDWITRNRLKAQDVIYFSDDSTGSMVMSATPSSMPKKALEIDIDSVDLIYELLFLCYIKNIDTVRFHATKIPYEKMKKVRETLKYLEGYDITHETESVIEISFLFKEINITMPKILQRMVYMLKTMCVSLESKDSLALEEIEMTLDKLSHLSTRIIFGCTASIEARKINAISHPEDLFFVEDMVKKLENVGDLLYGFKDTSLSAKEIDTVKNIIYAIEGSIFKSFNVPHAKSLLNGIKFPKSKDSDYELEKMMDLASDILDNITMIEFHKIYFK